MKCLKLIFISTILCIGLLSCSETNSDDSDFGILNPSEVYEAFDISYGEDTDQVFDVYLPANRTLNTKTIILVHGGGWTSGDKSDMNLYKSLLKEQLPTYAIVNINYRLATNDTSPYPMQINDITSVVNYLVTNQILYSISEDIGFVGVSAGAHLSLLWSYAFDAENQTKMVGSVVGPTNFTDPAYLENIDYPFFQDIINTFGVDLSIEFLEDVSPYHKVTASAPPTIMFYGGEDPLIPTSQGMALRDRLDELNVINEFTLYPEEGHGWSGLNLLDTTIKLKAFIETHL